MLGFTLYGVAKVGMCLAGDPLAGRTAHQAMRTHRLLTYHTGLNVFGAFLTISPFTFHTLGGQAAGMRQVSVLA